MEARVPVSRCNAVISWQNRRATLAGNCRKGRGEIRWTATPDSTDERHVAFNSDLIKFHSAYNLLFFRCISNTTNVVLKRQLEAGANTCIVEIKIPCRFRRV